MMDAADFKLTTGPAPEPMPVARFNSVSAALNFAKQHVTPETYMALVAALHEDRNGETVIFFKGTVGPKPF